MKRPFKVRSPHSRTRSFATFDAAMCHLLLIGELPEQRHSDYEFIDADGTVYPVVPMLRTAHTIREVYRAAESLLGRPL